jgi:acyl-CoA hydrolase
MTPAELQAIRERWQVAKRANSLRHPFACGCVDCAILEDFIHIDVPELVAEIEKLRVLAAGLQQQVDSRDRAFTAAVGILAEREPRNVALAKEVEKLQAERDELAELISRSAPVSWAAAGDIASASEWEKLAAAAIQAERDELEPRKVER